VPTRSFSLIIPAGVDITSRSLVNELSRSTTTQKIKSHKIKLSGNILVAEDNEVNQKVILSMLEKATIIFIRLTTIYSKVNGTVVFSLMTLRL